jgi:REP element-mobilizing transposase RayT
VVITDSADNVLAETCAEIEKRYEVWFLEVGADKDHVHFLIQSVPSYSVTKIVTMVKSIIAREVFKRCPDVKKQLWGGEFWGKGYFANTVGQHGTENVIAKYVKEQGVEKEYKTVNNPRGKPTRHLAEHIFLIDENHPFSKLSSKILGKPRGIKPNRD